MADVYSKQKRSTIMARVKTRQTGPEQHVAAILRRLGVRFRRNVRRLPGQPDFVIDAASTVVFVHGCFWHGHSACPRAKLPSTNAAFWRRKIAGNAKRDRRNARALRRQGWHVITVWQCRLRRPATVARRLRRYVGK